MAFGITGGDAPDRFVVGLAALSLLSDAAEEQPLLCAVDDAQWLDDESALALAFVARRLLAESVAMVFVTREPSQELSGLPELVLEGLDADDARALLGLRDPWGRRRTGPRSVCSRDTRQPPRLVRASPRGVRGRARRRFRRSGRRAADGSNRGELPEATRFTAAPRPGGSLLTAAAEPVGDPALLWRAAERSGLGAEAAEPAQTAGLIELGARVRFRHPLVRSAVYSAAAVPDRREAHRALAEATDPAADPIGVRGTARRRPARPDEEVAGELERSADRARARGGVAAAAAFLERAAELTPDAARRGGRALAAARPSSRLAAPEAANELLAIAELCPLDELQRARLARLRAQIAYARRRGSDAPPMLLDAARQLDAARSRAWRARRTSKRSARRCTPGACASTRRRAEGGRGGPGRACGARSPRGRSTCCSTEWRRDSLTGLGAGACARCGARSRRSGTRPWTVTGETMRWLCCVRSSRR